MDGAEYFGALRDALLMAERQVYILGWDIHSKMLLVGPSGRSDDGLPIELGTFLRRLLKIKPALQINILSWDFAALYAVEREWDSFDRFTDGSDGRIQFCLDSSLPIGSSQHQKIVAIDNAIAFVGGLDLTIRRWDTCEHFAKHPLRHDPNGKAYPPFHDVQCMVEGDAAVAIGKIASARWTAAGFTSKEFKAVEGNRWPASVPAEATQIRAGIARTELRTGSQYGIDEAAQLFKASIATANRLIYIENQFVSAIEIAHALVHRMADVPSLRVLIVTPKTPSSWLELQAMQGGGARRLHPFVRRG